MNEYVTKSHSSDEIALSQLLLSRFWIWFKINQIDLIKFEIRPVPKTQNDRILQFKNVIAIL